MSNILLVEDDITLTVGIEYALKNEGFEVSVANNLQEAEKAFTDKEHNLLILDVMLPDGSGYDFCRKIRARSKVPIIFLTACDEEVNVVMGLDIGGDDYITKPFRLKELLSRIRAVLRRNRKRTLEEAGILISGDISILNLEGKVRKKDAEIFLTPLEYKLLLTLVRNAKKVLTRNVLSEALWDIEGEFVDNNTLSVYIKRLREKIEDDSTKPVYIATARGLGYRWDYEVRSE